MGSTFYPRQIKSDEVCETGSVDFDAGTLKIGGVAVDPQMAIDGVTASAAELNILDGAEVTTAELNLLKDATQAANIVALEEAYEVGELDSEAKIITALNATNAAINDILAALEGFGVVASA
jgi:hypothetical protein